jgi:hypothetical protein
MQLRCLLMLTPDPSNPIGTGSLCAAMRDRCFNYPSHSYAGHALSDSAIWQLLSTLNAESGAQELMHTADANARALPPNAHSEPQQPHWRKIRVRCDERQKS